MGRAGWLATGVVFVLVGLVICAFALWQGVERHAFVQQAQRAPGEVLALNAGPFHPEVAFRTARGTRIRYAQGGFILPHHVGQQVQVRYLADAPRLSPVLDSWGALWGEVAFAALLGAVFVLVGGRRVRQALRAPTG